MPCDCDRPALRSRREDRLLRNEDQGFDRHGDACGCCVPRRRRCCPNALLTLQSTSGLLDVPFVMGPNNAPGSNDFILGSNGTHGTVGTGAALLTTPAGVTPFLIGAYESLSIIVGAVVSAIAQTFTTTDSLSMSVYAQPPLPAGGPYLLRATATIPLSTSAALNQVISMSKACLHAKEVPNTLVVVRFSFASSPVSADTFSAASFTAQLSYLPKL
jgi:hypothetical protein